MVNLLGWHNNRNHIVKMVDAMSAQNKSKSIYASLPDTAWHQFQNFNVSKSFSHDDSKFSAYFSVKRDGANGRVADGVLQSKACNAEIRFEADLATIWRNRRKFIGFVVLAPTILLTHGIAVLLHIRGHWNAERTRSTSVLMVFTSFISVVNVSGILLSIPMCSGGCQFGHYQACQLDSSA